MRTPVLEIMDFTVCFYTLLHEVQKKIVICTDLTFWKIFKKFRLKWDSKIINYLNMRARFVEIRIDIVSTYHIPGLHTGKLWS